MRTGAKRRRWRRFEDSGAPADLPGVPFRAGGEGAWVALPFMAAYTMGMLTESITLTWNDMRWVLFVAIATKLALGEIQPERWVRFSSARP